jgi:glycosyltransferase involved in cell wall biosynthesis
MVKRLRVFLTDGSGDAIESFRHWRAGEDIPTVTHVPFSGQTYTACAAGGAKVFVFSECARIAQIEDGDFEIEQRGNPCLGTSGFNYHLTEFIHSLLIICRIVRFRADVAVVGRRPNAFLLHLLRPFGIKVILNFHNVLWGKYLKPSRAQRILLWLDATYYRSAPFALSCVSEDIKKQIRQLAGRADLPFVDFLPWFRASTFDGISPPVFDGKQLSVMFAGRIEANKGIFEMLSMAVELRQSGHGNIAFEVCGDGSAMPALVEQVARHGMSDVFRLHGHCDRMQMREVLSRSHVVIVPTRRDFAEGFNMVIVEALLARRPVITSDVCPALSYISKAVVAVQPDAWPAYKEALLDLVIYPERYWVLQHHARAEGERFLSGETSWGSALAYMLLAARHSRKLVSREISTRSSEK